jgi:hypothetical protein
MHNTSLSVKKLLPLRDTEVTQGLLKSPIKMLSGKKTNDRYTSHMNSLSFQDTYSTQILQQYKIYMGFAKTCNYINAHCTDNF